MKRIANYECTTERDFAIRAHDLNQIKNKICDGSVLRATMTPCVWEMDNRTYEGWISHTAFLFKAAENKLMSEPNHEATLHQLYKLFYGENY